MNNLIVMELDEVLGKVSNLFRTLKNSATKLFWPQFDALHLPEDVQYNLDSLPAQVRQRYVEVYRERTEKLKNKRNVTLFISVFFGLTTFSFWLPIGFAFYWWHIKENLLPPIARKTLSEVKSFYAIPAYTTPQEDRFPRPQAFAGKEIFSAMSAPEKSQSREYSAHYDPSNLSLENLGLGFLLDYDLKTWRVTRHLQYDWLNGSTGLEFRITHDTQSLYLYVIREGSHLNTTICMNINIHAVNEQLETDILNSRRPASILPFKGNTYYRENMVEGYVFDKSGNSPGKNVLAWEYHDVERTHYLRVEANSMKQVKAMAGRIVSPYQFTEILPPLKS